MSKTDIRKIYRDKRRHISLEEKNQAAAAALKQLCDDPVFANSKSIACYLPNQDEFDVQPMIRAIWQHQKKCFLPVLTEERSLQFVQYAEGDALEKNCFGIPEPSDQRRRVDAAKLDLILTPLIAFDLAGRRLGTGGGYYDRTLAFKYKKNGCKPIIVGVAFALQQADTLPSDPWDVAIDGVLTEEKLIWF